MTRGRRRYRADTHPLRDGRIALVLLAGVVALTGGASRYDAIQIIPLRALCALFLIPALYFLTSSRIRDERMLLALFGGFTLLVCAQLIPLPPELWQALPGRHVLGELDAALRLEGTWRPLSLAPMRTWNALGSLVVPAAGLCLAVAVGASSRTLLRIVAALGVLNAVVGLLQIVTGRSSALYFYEMTNRGSPVGIFANENHAAIFAACSLLVLTRLGLSARDDRAVTWERMAYPFAFAMILLVSLVGASRAGFAAALGAMVVAIAMIVFSPRTHRKPSAGDAVRRWFESRPALMWVFPVCMLLLTLAAFVMLDRMPAFRDILTRDSLADLRWSLLPVVGDMLGDHWIFGSGLGSFEQTYHIYEPADLLMPQYINQAHNDWAQLIIEGGVVAGLLLVALLAWIGRAAALLSMNGSTRVNALFWISIFTLVALASLVDYPLRTPLFQLVMVWFLVAMSRDRRDRKAT